MNSGRMQKETILAHRQYHKKPQDNRPLNSESMPLPLLTDRYLVTPVLTLKSTQATLVLRKKF
jgi:hypothetical protein